MGPSQIDPDVVVGPGQGFNGLTVTVGPAAVPIAKDDLPEVKKEVAELIRQQAAGLHGEVTEEPTATTFAGLPAVETELSGVAEGTPIHIVVTFAWDGRTQYQLNCQSTSAELQKVTKGCDQARRSFSVGS